MAEAIMRHLGRHTVDCFSAGTNPSEVAQGALLALTKLGVSNEGLVSKSLEQFSQKSFDYVITLCEKASTECRESFSDNHHIVWDFPDPVEKNEANAFLTTANELSERIRMLLLIIEKQHSTPTSHAHILNSPSDLFKVLADPLRLSLVLALTQRAELCVCDFVAITGMSQPKVSRHLAQLREYALLVDRRDKRWVYYRINPAIPDWVRKTLQVTAHHNPSLIPKLQGVESNGCVGGGTCDAVVSLDNE